VIPDGVKTSCHIHHPSRQCFWPRNLTARSMTAKLSLIPDHLFRRSPERAHTPTPARGTTIDSSGTPGLGTTDNSGKPGLATSRTYTRENRPGYYESYFPPNRTPLFRSVVYLRTRSAVVVTTRGRKKKGSHGPARFVHLPQFCECPP
jgi:hypothetical protein